MRPRIMFQTVVLAVLAGLAAPAVGAVETTLVVETVEVSPQEPSPFACRRPILPEWAPSTWPSHSTPR